MANEEFEIEISPSGKVTVRTIGIKGPRASTTPTYSPRFSGGRNRVS